MTNMTTTISILLIVVALGAAVVVLAVQRLLLGRLARERTFASTDDAPAIGRPDFTSDQGFLTRWLSLAGYRRNGAAAVFVFATLLSMAAGGLTAFLLHASGLVGLLEQGAVTVPGGIGDMALPFIYLAPWLLLIAVGAAPWLIVRRTRRERVEQIEQDLPIALELMATLSEAGLGFDAALTRIFETRLASRALASEFRSFQADLLSGRPRIESLRRLSRRIDVSSVTIFVSALVQAEQLGMGVAEVLRRQADDVRDRRRERAQAFAMALPVKLMFPLVICFLPGLFVWTLGPVFLQFFQIADSLVRTRSF
jgi:tight adherence protein C